MDFTSLLIRPAKGVQGSGERARAGLLSVILIIRIAALALVFVFVFLGSTHEMHAALQPLTWSTILSAFAYLVSRTRHFRVGAYLITLDAMIFIPLTCYRWPLNDVLLVAPYWLSFGPLISSLILPVRQTVLITILTALSFILISSFIDPSYLHALGAAMIHFSLVSLIAAVGMSSRLRPRA